MMVISDEKLAVIYVLALILFLSLFMIINILLGNRTPSIQIYLLSRDSSVSIVTTLRAGQPRFESWQGRGFFPSPPPIVQWVPQQ
jgi:hypothetical protein